MRKKPDKLILDNSSLECGRIVKGLKGGYLVRVAEGSIRFVYTDQDTLGDGPVRLGEDSHCQVEDDRRPLF